MDDSVGPSFKDQVGECRKIHTVAINDDMLSEGAMTLNNCNNRADLDDTEHSEDVHVDVGPSFKDQVRERTRLDIIAINEVDNRRIIPENGINKKFVVNRFENDKNNDILYRNPNNDEISNFTGFGYYNDTRTSMRNNSAVDDNNRIYACHATFVGLETNPPQQHHDDGSSIVERQSTVFVPCVVIEDDNDISTNTADARNNSYIISLNNTSIQEEFDPWIVPSIATNFTNQNNDFNNSANDKDNGECIMRTFIRYWLETGCHKHTSNNNDVTKQNRITELQKRGFPIGICYQLLSTQEQFPLRFWIIDNSGSMLASDGHRVLNSNTEVVNHHRTSTCNATDKPVHIRCSRWRELQSTLEFHTWFAGTYRVPSFFRLVNDPGVRVGPQEFVVTKPDDIQNANDILSNTKPESMSNLTEHLIVIYNRIIEVQDILRQNGQRIVVTVATDGIPSNRSSTTNENDHAETTQFVKALRDLQLLPVWIVIRLFTDDKNVLEYYHSLDCDVELSIDVVDDYINEAKHIKVMNKWLNYTPSFQRCREMGYDKRVYDLLNEKSLSKEELHDFLCILFGSNVMNHPSAPNVHTSDWNEYSTFIAKLNIQEGKQFDPILNKSEYLIDIKALNKLYRNNNTAGNNDAAVGTKKSSWGWQKGVNMFF